MSVFFSPPLKPFAVSVITHSGAFVSAGDPNFVETEWNIVREQIALQATKALLALFEKVHGQTFVCLASLPHSGLEYVPMTTRVSDTGAAPTTGAGCPGDGFTAGVQGAEGQSQRSADRAQRD